MTSSLCSCLLKQVNVFRTVHSQLSFLPAPQRVTFVKMSSYTDKVPELRKKFLDKHYSSEKNYYDSRDISRVKSDDHFVLQFLNGREGNVDKAHKTMIEGLKWRNSFGINNVSEKDIHEDILKSGIIYMHGKDKKGATLLITTAAKFTWKGDKEKIESYQKFLALCFEKHQREHPEKKITMLSQCEGSGLANTDMDTNKLAVQLLTNVYPDILENSVLLNFPTLLKPIWQITKALMNSNLAKRYVFPGKDEVSQYVDKDQLPVAWGGEDTFEYKYPPDKMAATDSNSNVDEPALVS